MAVDDVCPRSQQAHTPVKNLSQILETSDVPSTAAASTTIVPVKKRKARSGEMVRISALSQRDQIHSCNLVRRTRITFESIRRLLILRRDGLSEVSGHRRRPDLKAAALMADKNLWLNRDKRIIGSIPGVYVGDIFFFRMELCIVGLHGQVQAGIDYVPSTCSLGSEPVATSIIVSGGYEDDDDRGEVLIYTGHGGRDGKNFVDQKLERGNLALEKSRVYGVEIRVIRGINFDRSPTKKLYVYDGLYKIVDSWIDNSHKSALGRIYKYKLLRIDGQEAMGSENLKLAEELKVNPSNVRPTDYLLSLDISMKKEKLPVMLFNDLDDEQDPMFFDYLVKPLYPPSVFQDESLLAGGTAGCGCVTNCSTGCHCAILNGGEFPYDANGLLVMGKPLIYECGIGCRCPPSCPNRVSQKGLRHQLEIFRSRETGWGVRSLDVICAGSFVCEYSGIVLTNEQSDSGDQGLVWPNRFPEKWKEWGDISNGFPDLMQPSNYPASVPGLNFSIDVSRTRNVACYLSHSSSRPNVFLQFVLFDHHNKSYPHLMVFAMENIPPLRELSIDYGV